MPDPDADAGLDLDPDDPVVAYEPTSVKTVLVEMKDTAELLIDLAYSAVLSGDPAVARAVLDLEARMDVLQLRGRMSLLVAARSPEDAETLAPVLGVLAAAEKISDAAGDIAKTVLDDEGPSEALRAVLPEGTEPLVRATVTADGALAGQSIAAAALTARVVAVERGGAETDYPPEWLLDPTPDTTLSVGDTVLLRGAETAVADSYAAVTGATYEPPAPSPPAVTDLDRAVEAIVLMKDMAELAVDLAYGAILFDSPAVAEEVLALEAEVDALQSRFEAWTLRAAARVDDPVRLRGLVRLAGATEVISDAAVEISEGVLRGLGTHPVVAEAIGDADEVVVRLTVGEDAGGRIGDLDAGARVIAVRRGDAAATGEATDLDDRPGWVVSPDADTRLRPHDTVIAVGPEAVCDRLRAALEGADVDEHASSGSTDGAPER